jgi:chromosome segregation ATPase
MNNYNDHGAAEAAKDAEIARLRDEIEELRERMREAAKLNMGLMDIRRDNEAEIERLRMEAKQASASWQEDKRHDEAEIERLRGLLRAAGVLGWVIDNQR